MADDDRARAKARAEEEASKLYPRGTLRWETFVQGAMLMWERGEFRPAPVVDTPEAEPEPVAPAPVAGGEEAPSCAPEVPDSRAGVYPTQGGAPEEELAPPGRGHGEREWCRVKFEAEYRARKVVAAGPKVPPAGSIRPLGSFLGEYWDLNRSATRSWLAKRKLLSWDEFQLLNWFFSGGGTIEELKALPTGEGSP